MTRLRGRSVPALLLVGALVGCGTADADADADASAATTQAEECGEPIDAEPGELRPVLRSDWFDPDAAIYTAAALGDGSILVAYDTNPDEAGDADDLAGEEREPGLVVLRSDGSCEPFDLPAVGGRPVQLDAKPVAVDGQDRLYLWDGSAQRLVRGHVGGPWEMVTTIPDETGWPHVTVGADGQVFVATNHRISTVAADGTLQTLAGTGEEYWYNTDGPLELPGPGTSTPLPGVRGIRALPSGGLLVSTKSSVLTLQNGTLDLLADWDTTSGHEGAIQRDSWLGSLAVLPSGDVLVSNLPGQRILRLTHGRSSVFLADESYVSMAYPTPLLADGSALLVHRQGTLAVYGLPD